jgi:hypothetical protein
LDEQRLPLAAGVWAGVGGAALLSQEFSAANKRFPDFAFFRSVELRPNCVF